MMDGKRKGYMDYKLGEDPWHLQYAERTKNFTMWTTANRESIPITEMEKSHVENTIKYLQNKSIPAEQRKLQADKENAKGYYVNNPSKQAWYMSMLEHKSNLRSYRWHCWIDSFKRELKRREINDEVAEWLK